MGDEDGTVVLEGTALLSHPAAHEPLYRSAAGQPATGDATAVPIRLIPYARWANRGATSMRVWVRLAGHR